MSRLLSGALGLVVGVGIGVLGIKVLSAQEGCVQLNEAQLLASFSDSAGAQSISPQSLRNLVCSVQLR